MEDHCVLAASSLAARTANRTKLESRQTHMTHTQTPALLGGQVAGCQDENATGARTRDFNYGRPLRPGGQLSGGQDCKQDKIGKQTDTRDTHKHQRFLAARSLAARMKTQLEHAHTHTHGI